jgi:regulation of enolase protein 1 (concanavalin A-like superfamily)
LPNLTRQGGALLLGIACGVVAFSHPAAAQTSSLMPAGWTSSDIGSPAVSGSADVSADTMTVRGAGADIGGISDQFHFVYQAMAGDVDIRIRVADLQDVNPGAKAGLMIRASLAANAKHAFMLVSAEQGLAFQWRSQAGKKSAQVSGAAVGAPAWVRLVRKGNMFSAYSSPTGAVWTLVGSTAISMSKNAYVGLAVTSHDPNQTATGSFASMSFGSSSSSSVPAPWAAGDLGSPALAGSASASGGTFTVTGAGSDIWNTSDQFQFVYQPVTGDTQIVAWVANLQAADVGSKAGVMIREALTGQAANAFMSASGSNGWGFTRRLAAAGVTYQSAGNAGTAPGWVRLVREGSLFSAYQSQDGSQWTLIDTDIIAMPATVYVGLAVTSRNTAATATATLSNVTISTPTSSNTPPTVSISSPASGASFTAPASIAISATAGDTDGSVTRVDFYSGTQLVGSATASPFTYTWSNVPAGTYSLTAVATDNEAATTTSQPVSVTVGGNKPPTVSISSPATGASYTAPASITISATVGDTDGSVTRLDFYAGAQLVGSVTTTPNTITWSNVAAGTYSLTAVATDNAGATATSQPVSVTVTAATNKPPTVSISAPAAGTSYTAPASITISATAADTDGSVTRVDFYANGQLRGSDTSSPFSFPWSSVAAGTYSLTAVATDNTGATATSAPVGVTVTTAVNKPPTVSISGPTGGATYTAPASITINATAADADGSVAGVAFYANGQLLGSDASSPFSLTWSAAAGTYSLTAVATDNSGATATSQPVSVTVFAAAIPSALVFVAPLDYATNVTSCTVELRRSVDAVTAAPVATGNLGKPAIVNGEISVDVSTLVNSLPAGSYYAVVVATGPGGSTPSSPSAAFSK